MIGIAESKPLPEIVVSWENRLDARIGVMARQVSSDWERTYRADERFPMCSTFKSLLCGAILARVDAGEEDLDNHVSFLAEDLVTYSPITERHVGEGMSVGKLCEAAITRSDNTAGNLLLERIGGPAGLTAFLVGIGDSHSRLDRWETELNESIPGDHRDTTTPRSIASSLERLLFGEILRESSATTLRQWLVDDKMADGLLRAHLPAGWKIGDKTGAGEYGSRGIVGFLLNADDEAFVVAIYLTETESGISLRNEAISDIGRAIIREIDMR